MSYNTKPILKDSSGYQPIPQYYNPTTDVYEPVQGQNNGANVNIIGGSSLNTGLVPVTTSGTRVQLPSNTCREVTVIARKENTGSIYVGGSSVSSTSFGVELAAGDSFTFAINNSNLLFIDSSVSGEGISYVTI